MRTTRIGTLVNDCMPPTEFQAAKVQAATYLDSFALPPRPDAKDPVLSA
jgi:hypothetical protein